MNISVYQDQLEQIEGTSKVFQGSTRLKGFWASIMLPIIYFTIHSLRKKLQKQAVFIDSMQVTTLKDAQNMHRFYVILKKAKQTFEKLEIKDETHSYWDRKILEELKIIVRLNNRFYETLAEKLFPTPEGMDKAAVMKESEKLRDFFDDLDDDETDYAYLAAHPNLVK